MDNTDSKNKFEIQYDQAVYEEIRHRKPINAYEFLECLERRDSRENVVFRM